MKTLLLVGLILFVSSGASAWELLNYECGAGTVTIKVKETGSLQGPEALAWLFRYGYLRYPDMKTRAYRYTCAPISEIAQADLVPTKKFARWQLSHFGSLASK
jgi:hypothetical protein